MIPYVLASAGSALANHLWQSTVFVAAVWLMTLLLRRNHARIRYALWFAASLKFLLPFSLLISLGTLLPQPQRIATPSQQTMYTAIDTVGQPFSNLTPTIPPTLTPSSPKTPILPLALTAAWLCGAALLLLIWSIRWHQLSATLRISTPSHHGREHDILRRLEQQTSIRKPITLKLSKDPIEPGIAGILHPTLLWPERLSDHLEDRHIEAIIAHELIHVRRRDNLTAALHMLVGALFWFHPLVWWIEKRMLEERERSCDEAVVQMGSKPGTYAESLLKACRFCLESPLPCVSGITGSDLSLRVHSIMSLRLERLSLAKKLLLTAAVIFAAAVPILFGQIGGTIDTTLNSNLKFEVATIKPSGSTNGVDHDLHIDSTAGRLTMTATVQWMTCYAYNIGPRHCTGGPDWTGSDLFDIVAKVDAEQAAAINKMPHEQQNHEYRLMLRSLLNDRFKLQVKQETKELPIYELVVAKGGPKLTPAISIEKEKGSSSMSSSSNRTTSKLTAKNATMERLAAHLGEQSSIERMVVDRTGLKDSYDFDLTWQREEMQSDTSGPSIFSALQEQLGLKLQATKAPVNLLVIDHIERPTAN